MKIQIQIYYKVLKIQSDSNGLSSVFISEASCPEVQLRGQLQGLGLSGEGDPCRWPGIECYYCYVLEIHSTKATGNLSSVKEMTELAKLDLKGSQVTGDIAELSKLKNLQYLNLAQTQVMGNVEKLSQLKALQILSLSQTQVVGDVTKLRQLMHLDLSQTQVLGDLAELSNLTLAELRLSQTKVHGNIGFISSMPALVQADLSGTAVSGNLKDLQRGCCKNLRELHLGVPALLLCSNVFFCVCVEKCSSKFYSFFKSFFPGFRSPTLPACCSHLSRRARVPPSFADHQCQQLRCLEFTGHKPNLGLCVRPIGPVIYTRLWIVDSLFNLKHKSIVTMESFEKNLKLQPFEAPSGKVCALKIKLRFGQ